jgi:hypothetical protein
MGKKADAAVREAVAYNFVLNIAASMGYQAREIWWERRCSDT